MASATAAPSASLKRIRQELKEWEHTFRRLHGRSPSKDDIKASPSIRALYRQYALLKVKVEGFPSISVKNSLDVNNKHFLNGQNNLVSVRPTSPATESSDGSHVSATPPRKKSFTNIKVEILSMKTETTPYNIRQSTSDACRPILGDIRNKLTAPKICYADAALSDARKQSTDNSSAFNRPNRADEKSKPNEKPLVETSALGFTIRMQRYGEPDKENLKVEYLPAGFCLNRVNPFHATKSLSFRASARTSSLFHADTTDAINMTISAGAKPLDNGLENKTCSPLDSEGNNRTSSKEHDNDVYTVKSETERDATLMNLQNCTTPQSKRSIAGRNLHSNGGKCEQVFSLNEASSEAFDCVDKAEGKSDVSENLLLGGAISQAYLASMTVTALRGFLSLNGLPVGGKKATLIARVLHEAKKSADMKLPSSFAHKIMEGQKRKKGEEAGTAYDFHSGSCTAVPGMDTLQTQQSKKSRKSVMSKGVSSKITGCKFSKSTVGFINWHSVPKTLKRIGARENFVKLNLGRNGGRSNRFINAVPRRKLGAGKYRFKRYGKRKAKKSPGSYEEDAADCAEDNFDFEINKELLGQESEVLLHDRESNKEAIHFCENANSLTLAAAEALQTPTVQNLQSVLQLLVGYKSFRPGQLETIQSIMAGKSTMLVLPTGAGKSLTYQLPSFLLPGVTLVVSPLVSVMVDQAQHLPPSLPGAVLSSMQTPKEYCSILDRLQSGRLKVLFISPERLLCEKFVCGLQDLPCISLAVVDEAHCLSEWSHNFRPAYHRLGVILRQRLNIKCVLALTATATRRTLDSILQTLSIAPANLMQLSILRNNLIYMASSSNNRCKDLISLLLSSPYKDANSIIIYCNFQLEADNVSLVLRDNGIDAKSYHGGMNPTDRKRIQSLFCTNKLRVIVATVAFGLGLDKSDVSAVIHYGLPNSVEHYVQETGRAGRNGDLAHCHLLLDNVNYLKLRSLAFSDNVDISAIQGLLSVIFCDTSNKGSSCPIHCISIESATKDLDLKEEIMKTALSYLEIGDVQFVSVLPNIKTTCSMQFHKNSPYLLARNSLLIDAILRRSQKKNGEFVFELPSVANYMGLKLPDLQQQLQALQSAGEISFNLKNPSLCFYVLEVPKDLSTLAVKILERFTSMEDLKVKKLDFMFHTAVGLTIKERTSSELQSLLQERIQQYFESEGEESIDCKPPSFLKQSSTSPFLKADIKVFLQKNPTSRFTSRAIARIFHGIPSPAFPSNLWSQNHFWGRYTDTDFYAIKETEPVEVGVGQWHDGCTHLQKGKSLLRRLFLLLKLFNQYIRDQQP
ncbi:hypothetical protein GOP47_0026511 [Adiantum capillus-veneris]|nr:hypothetical protein GOP47_0026511 [Adiantum capillus-veneris]